MGKEIPHIVRDYLFTWDTSKAKANLAKHGVSFEEACEVFFFPYYDMQDASVHDEQRWGFTGYSKRGRLLYVVAVEQGEEAWRIVSARELTSSERDRYEKKDDSN
jgi:uncharacterized DUF497 family protein